MGTNCHRKRSEFDTVLVIGATGVLRPSVRQLVSHPRSVVAVARSQRKLDQLADDLRSPWLRTLAHDARDPVLPDVLDKLQHQEQITVTDALVYGPATTSAVIERLADRIPGTVVEILTSHAANPAHRERWDARPPVRRTNHRRLLLGWQHVDGKCQWHDSARISESSLAMLTGRSDQILGTVTPWSERPK